MLLQSLLLSLLTLRSEAKVFDLTLTQDAGYAVQPTVVEKDVLIIGGGSSGTYAAFKLLDANKTVLVVEKEDIMGGHVNTYVDPSTGVAVDYGVVVYHNNDLVKNYFARLNVSYVNFNVESFQPKVSKEVDFNTGEIVTDYVAQNPEQALIGYYGQVSKYPYVEQGFDLEYPVPEDLLLPFGAFAEKYNLTGMEQFLYSFAQGLANVMDQPTLYVFKNFGTEIIRDLAAGFLTTTDHNNAEIYTAAANLLKKNSSVELSSLVTNMLRSDSGIQAYVAGPDGLKLVKAKQVLISIPPKLPLLANFDVSLEERTLFQKFNNSAYWTMLIDNTGLPDNVTFNAADPNTQFQIPRMPSIYYIGQTAIPGLFNVKYGSTEADPDEQVKKNVIDSIKALNMSGVAPGAGCEEINFVEFKGHNPFELTVSVDEIRNGFYKDLYAIQGNRSTWWTGAAWHTQDSALLWEFTDGIVERMLAAL